MIGRLAGGRGMLMKPEPIFEAVDQLFPGNFKKNSTRFVYLSPRGAKFDHKKAKRFSRYKRLIFLCGHYEGVDQRVIDELATDEISIGDYILTGGELAAMVVIDAVARWVPGVLGREESKAFESFTQNLLEYPQYTRPAVYRGLKVPAVLLSGDHQRIELWRKKQALGLTRARRPDLLIKGV
jgi:tRNA (guanine37-N1)-methyltransferase